MPGGAPSGSRRRETTCRSWSRSKTIRINSRAESSRGMDRQLLSVSDTRPPHPRTPALTDCGTSLPPSPGSGRPPPCVIAQLPTICKQDCAPKGAMFDRAFLRLSHSSSAPDSPVMQMERRDKKSLSRSGAVPDPSRVSRLRGRAGGAPRPPGIVVWRVRSFWSALRGSRSRYAPAADNSGG